MSKTEALILTAYTGVLMTDWDSFHGFAEKMLGRPIWTHQFPMIADELKEKVKPMFLDICKNLH